MYGHVFGTKKASASSAGSAGSSGPGRPPAKPKAGGAGGSGGEKDPRDPRDPRGDDASSLTCSEASDESLKSFFGVGGAGGSSSPKDGAGASASSASGRPPLPPRTLVDACTQTDLPVAHSWPRGVDTSTQTKGTVAKPPLDPAGGASSEGESDSSSSQHSDANGEVGTSKKKRQQHVEGLMRRWKLPVAQKHFCCAYHQALTAVSACVDKLSHSKCKPLWCPATGYHCSACEAIVEAAPSAPDGSCVVCSLVGISCKTPWCDRSFSSGSKSATTNQRGETSRSTPMSTVAATYLELARHWRLNRMESACCLFHMHALVAMEVAETLDQEPCNPAHTQCSGWSCEHCDCDNDYDAQACEICGELQEFSTSFTRPPSTKRSL